jgi:hypothetical protein
MRTVAGWHGCLYTTDAAGLWIHHYGANRATIALPAGGSVQLAMETDYPWDGKITVRLEKVDAAGPFAVRLRIPEWAKDASLAINGQASATTPSAESYCELKQAWKAADVIELTLPMPVRMMVAKPRLEQTRGQVAVLRGPIVYCLESTDLPEGVSIDQVAIPRDASWQVQHESDLLGGVTTLSTQAAVLPAADPDGPLYQELPQGEIKTIPIRLIPHYAWNNRGEPEMSIWLLLR